MKNLGWFIGGALVGATALGLAAFYSDKYFRDKELEEMDDNSDDGCAPRGGIPDNGSVSDDGTIVL